MKCKNCGFVNPEGSIHCKKCHTMLRTKEQLAATGGMKALVQIILLIVGLVAAVGILWVIMHDLLHAV